MLSLNNLQKSKSIKPSKRLGRGNASGSGNYSTRGMKGQRSRSGGKSGLMSRSIKGYLLRIPKNRGFRSLQSKMIPVNVGELDKNFKEGTVINARQMLKVGLIKNISKGVKILSQGKLSKKFTVEADAFSVTAKAKIEKAGGQTVVVGQFSASEEKKNKSE